MWNGFGICFKCVAKKRKRRKQNRNEMTWDEHWKTKIFLCFSYRYCVCLCVLIYNNYLWNEILVSAKKIKASDLIHTHTSHI